LHVLRYFQEEQHGPGERSRLIQATLLIQFNADMAIEDRHPGL
jgi:hypothetical protein